MVPYKASDLLLQADHRGPPADDEPSCNSVYWLRARRGRCGGTATLAEGFLGDSSSLRLVRRTHHGRNVRLWGQETRLCYDNIHPSFRLLGNRDTCETHPADHTPFLERFTQNYTRRLFTSKVISNDQTPASAVFSQDLIRRQLSASRILAAQCRYHQQPLQRDAVQRRRVTADFCIGTSHASTVTACVSFACLIGLTVPFRKHRALAKSDVFEYQICLVCGGFSSHFECPDNGFGTLLLPTNSVEILEMAESEEPVASNISYQTHKTFEVRRQPFYYSKTLGTLILFHVDFR